MTIYFMGGEMGAFIPSDATSFETTGTPWQTWNTSFARCGLVSGQGSAASYSETATFAAPDDCWFHFELVRMTSSTTTVTGIALSASGTDVFRLRTSDTTVQMQALISAVWTNVGAAVSIDMLNRQTFDLHIVGNSGTGTATLYTSGTERATGTANLTAVTGITTLRCYGINAASGHAITQTMVADEPTVGWRLATYYPSAAGATGDWTGDYTGVDEAVYSDADFIYSGTNGQVELYTGTGPALTGYVVRAVGVYARAKRGAAGPANLQLALRVSGSNYFSASKALGLGYGAWGNIWEDNPDTAIDWLTAAIPTLQFGAKAVT